MIDTAKITAGRVFQVWEYKISHGSLLIRSPAGVSHQTNVDLVFFGVEYISLPTMLGKIELQGPGENDIRLVKSILGTEVEPEWIRVFLCWGKRFFVVASHFKLEETEVEPLDSRFLWGS